MITEMQHKTYQFIRNFRLKCGYSPTEAEIAKGIGIRSRGVAHRYVKALVEARLITTEKNRKRSIRLIDGVALPAGDIPITGTIAAGVPFTVTTDQRALNAAEYLLASNRFALEVKGDVLIDQHICDGDYLICEPFNAQFYHNERLVIILDDTQVLLCPMQHLQNQLCQLMIEPQGGYCEPISTERMEIKGIYRGLLRFSA